MPSRRRLRFAPEADDDFAGIVRYGVETWGQRQMEAYTESLYEALDHLRRFPRMGRQRDEISPGLRSYPVGQHVVFYRVRDDELIVVRIVYGRRDVEGELRGRV